MAVDVTMRATAYALGDAIIAMVGDFLLAQLDAVIPGVTGAMFDLSDWCPELARVTQLQARSERLDAEIAEWSGPAHFEAYCACPKCGHEAFHWLRQPGGATTVPPRTLREEALGRVAAIAAHQLIVTGCPSAPAQVVYEVVRTCTRCTHEWGQI